MSSQSNIHIVPKNDFRCPYREYDPKRFYEDEDFTHCEYRYYPTLQELKDHIEEHHNRLNGMNRCCPRYGKHLDTWEAYRQHINAEVMYTPLSDEEAWVEKAKEHPEYGYWDGAWEKAESPAELKTLLGLDGSPSGSEAEKNE